MVSGPTPSPEFLAPDEPCSFPYPPVYASFSAALSSAIALSESCLWLPVVEQGRRVLGTRALNPEQLEREAEKILRASEPKELRALATDVHPQPRRAGVPRRKSPAA